MNDPCRVRVTGPLACYVAGFRCELAKRGYSPGTAAGQLQLMAQLSRWLEGEGLDAGGLTAERVERFFALRRARVRTLHRSPHALRVLLEHLDDVGVLPAPRGMELSAAGLLVARFGTYLVQERGLADGSAVRYRLIATRFLAWCDAGGVEFGELTLGTVTGFLTAQCTRHSAGWAKCVTTSLRSFLRFLSLEGLIEVDLAKSVPSPAGWAAASLPRALNAADLAAVLASCDDATAAGRRDLAVLLLAARLGLRAGEIVGLGLSDIDWINGEIRVTGKGPRVDMLPLPHDVGAALAAYVRGGRPALAGVLLRRIGAPHGPLAASTVSGIVYRACDRAGVAKVGAHRLRHTAASAMLQGGASLSEIAQVLRHRSPNTTAIYAKVDRRTLAGLARPWPAGV